MFKSVVFAVFALLFLTLAVGSGFLISERGERVSSEPAPFENIAAIKAKAVETYGKLPIRFEKNVGQTDESVDFVSRGSGYSLLLRGSDVLLALSNNDREKPQNAFVSLRLEGSNGGRNPSGIDETEGKSNYFIGNDPAKWQQNVPNYKKVKYEAVYDGVDLVYYGNQRQLEYDFIVAPNADLNQIKLKISGVDDASIDQHTGDLLLKTAVGEIRQNKPFSYQMIDGLQTEIASSYKLKQKSGEEFILTLDVAEYDKSKELTIDPILVYGSYLGGSEYDRGSGIAVDSNGNAYITGTAKSLDFPTTTGVIKPALLPRSGTTNSYWNDAFVTKINPAGTAIVFSTYYGGRNANETGTDIQLDSNGNIYISGTTMSSDFPVVNAFQTTFGGTDDAYAAKLNPTGSAIIYSTFLGGSNTDIGARLAVNPVSGEATFTGRALSPNFPTTPGALKEKLCDSAQTCSGIFYSGSFVVRLAANGDVQFSTLFDARINDVALDQNENSVVAGTGSALLTTPGAYQTSSTGGVEGYVGKLNPAGNQIVFGTLLGGGLESDVITGIALDSAQNIYVTGQTENAGFPTTPGAFDTTFNGTSNTEDGFLTKFNAAGSALVYSTFLGGTGADEPKDIALGIDDSAFIVGETTGAASFPLKNSLMGSGSIFLTHFNADASGLVYSTILGFGGGYAIAVDSGNNAYITGQTNNVLVSPSSFQPGRGGGSILSPDDAYVLKVGPADENATHYSISGTVSGGNTGNNYASVVANISGTVNRSIIVGYSGGPYSFGNLPAGGDYTVTVTKLGFEVSPASAVFNNLGANQFADFTILSNARPEGVITSPAHGTNYDAPASITIQASASDPDAGDTIAKVDFVAYNSSFGNVELGTDTTAPYEISWANVPIGTWALYAIPTDNHGLRGYSIPTVHVFVNDPAPVTVSFISPTEGQAFEQNTNILLEFSVSSSVTFVEVHDETGTLVAIRNRSPWTALWWANQLGDKTLTATAYNSQGQTATSAPLNISIVPINHLISGTIYNSITLQPVPNVPVSLTGTSNISAQTTTDAIGQYSFTDLGGSTSDIVTITPNLAAYTFEPSSRGFTLNFIDHTNQNFSAVPVTGITVAMTSPAGGQQFPQSPTISLAADATSQNDAITKVEFYAVKQGIVVLTAEDTTTPYSFDWVNAPSGSISIYARAYDDVGGIADSDRVNISVATAPNVIRLQGAVTNANSGWMQGITLRLTGTANGQPINQTSVSNSFGSYGFFNLAPGGDYTITPEGFGGTTFTPVSFSVTNATADNYDVDFQASTVNQAPQVQITNPTDGAIFTMPVTIPMTASATDTDGQVTHFTMSAVSSTRSYTIGQVNNGTFNIPWQPSEPGDYTIYATARDNGGLRTTKQIMITVNAPAPVEISGRIVDRSSNGIPSVTLTLDNTSDVSVDDTTVMTDASGNYTIPNVTTFNSYRVTAAKLNYSFSPSSRNYFNISTSQTAGDFTGTLQVQPSDFDGDGMTDIAVWRPSDGVWHLNRSFEGYTSQRFGGAVFGDVPAPGDYDGDGKIDIAVYRNGIWYIQRSSDNRVDTVHFGLPTDLPVVGDYDGDGKTDIAVWRPSDGFWYIQRSSDSQYDFRAFGQDGDIPLVGDYDGDGKTDLTVWRPSSGVWYVLQSMDAGFRAYQFGIATDIPLVGDFDGDKIADFVVFRPETGTWYVSRSSDAGFMQLNWGIQGDIPVPGDFDRDGRTDFGVFRKSEGNWYIYGSATGTVIVQHFGLAGDIPIPAAYNQ